MRHLLSLLLLAIAWPASGALLGLSFNSTNRTTTPTNLHFRASTLTMAPVTGAAGKVGFMLPGQFTKTTNSGAADTVLYTNTVPGNLLTNTGDAIRFEWQVRGDGGASAVHTVRLNGADIKNYATDSSCFLSVEITRISLTNALYFVQVIDSSSTTVDPSLWHQYVTFGANWGVSLTAAGTTTGNAVLHSTKAYFLPAP